MKYKLGQLVTQYDEINQKGEFDSLEHLQGINSLKFFQECKSNKNDIDLNRYRICRKGMFAYNRATSRNGERISIAYRTGEDCLISPSYYCFSINDETILLPEYLDIWIKRPVFDKYARFNSWGSATEFFTFEDFCETEIDLPSIEEQRKIVHDYKVITNRIELLKKINENLEEMALSIYKKRFSNLGSDKTLLPRNWTIKTVGEIANVTRGASPRPIEDYMADTGMPWVKISDASESNSKYLRKTKEYIIDEGVSKSRLIDSGTLIVSNSASPGLPMIMRIQACVHDGWLIIRDYKEVTQEYLYYFFLNERRKLVASSNGSVFNNLKTDIVKNFPIVIPSLEEMHVFTKIISSFNGIIEKNSFEIEILELLSFRLLKINKED